MKTAGDTDFTGFTLLCCSENTPCREIIDTAVSYATVIKMGREVECISLNIPQCSSQQYRHDVQKKVYSHSLREELNVLGVLVFFVACTCCFSRNSSCYM